MSERSKRNLITLAIVCTSLLVSGGVVLFKWYFKEDRSPHPTEQHDEMTLQQMIDNKGTFKDGVYENSLFGLTISVPTEWSEQIGQGPDTPVTVKGNKDAILLQAWQKPKGAPMNASFTCGIKDVSKIPDIKTGADYLRHIKNMYENSSSQFDIKCAAEFGTAEIGKKTFSTLDTESTFNSVRAKQRRYATLDKDFALFFIVTYVDDTQKSAVESIVASVKFKH